MVFKFGTREFKNERHFFIELERLFISQVLLQRKPFDLAVRDFCKSCGLTTGKAIDSAIGIASNNPEFYEKWINLRDKIFEKIAIRNVRRIEEKKKIKTKAKTLKLIKSKRRLK